jgi:hypothetical protein
MLERPGPQSRRRDRQRAWRARVKAGVTVVPVEVDAAILELLTRLHWLEDRDAGGQAGSRGRDRAHAAGRGAALGLCVTVTQSPTEKLERKSRPVSKGCPYYGRPWTAKGTSIACTL